MQHEPHVAVVGGGISGLTAAYRLTRRGARVTVVESADRLGGKIHASPVAGTEVDAGAESVLARRPEALDLFEDLGLSDRVVHPGPGPAAVYSRGRLRPLPAGQLMGVPGDLRALARTGVLSPAGTLRAALDLLWPRTPVRGDVPVAAYIGTRMGAQVVDRLVEPLLGGVYAGRADLLSLDSTLPQLASPAREERSLVRAVRGLTARRAGAAPPGPVFATLRGGLAVLVGALAEQSGARIRTGTPVRGLRRGTAGAGAWELDLGEGPALTADGVVLACPAPAAARLLRQAAPEAARDLAAVEYASMALVTMAYPARAFPRPPAGSGFLVPAGEGLTIKAATFSTTKWPWLAEELRSADPDRDLVVLRCSIGRFGEEEPLRASDTDLVAAAAADLERVCGVSGPPVETRVTRWEDGLPQYTVGHAARVERVHAAVAPLPGLALCGAAYGGVGIPACIADADRAVRAVADELLAGPARPKQHHNTGQGVTT